MALDAGAKVTVMSGVGQAVPDEMNRIGMHSMPYAWIQIPLNSSGINAGELKTLAQFE